MTTTKLAAMLALLCVVPFLNPAVAEGAPTRASLQSELNKLSTEISILDEDFNESRLNLARVESRLRDSEAQMEKAETEAAALKERASERAAAVYKQGAPNLFMVMLTSRSTEDLGRRIGIVSKVNEWESAVVEDLVVAGERLERETETLQSDLERARTIRDLLNRKRASLEARVAKQKKILEQIAAAEAAAAAAAARARAARPKPSARPSTPPPSLPPSGAARTAVQTAYDQIGKPYRWGASGPDSFDCSGLTMFSWGKAGVSLPHSSRAQYGATKRVAREDLQPGDLVFFGSPIHHVGMYVGNGNMINAPETGDYVGVRSMNRRDYVGAGRPGV